ncbi:MAG: hypothetical protein J5789_01160 [Oscillospiraceae bacterium]|nr:hypothetical protein [Oscillospiraceae bacterium]
MKKLLTSLVAIIVIVIAIYSINHSKNVAINQVSQTAQNNSNAENQNSNSQASQSSQSGSNAANQSRETVKPTEPVHTPKSSCDVGRYTTVFYRTILNDDRVLIGVPIYNSGETDLYLDSATIDLKDDTGHLIDSIRHVSFYPKVLKPGETAWGFEDTIIKEKPETGLILETHLDVKAATVPCVRYEVSDITISNERFGGVEVTGQVTNTYMKELDQINVAILLFDNDDNLVACLHTYIYGPIKAGEMRGFSTSTLSSYKELVAENIKTYAVYAYPTQYQFG